MHHALHVTGTAATLHGGASLELVKRTHLRSGSAMLLRAPGVPPSTSNPLLRVPAIT
jgi:hypothetical protein